MHVLIMPTIESICEDYGLDYNDTNEKELLEQQGLEAYQIEVNDGETFEIPVGFIGRLIDNDQTYYMSIKVDDELDYYDKEEFQDDLLAGQYKLDEDTITLMIAESCTEEMDVMVKVGINLINQQNV